MAKMTLKEAQEVLEKYNSQIPTLFQGLLECSRDWQAWTYKTMQEDDFHPAEENDTTIAEAEIFIEKLLEAARVVERASVFKEGELKKLKDLRDICTQDDLLDLDSYDSIERSIKISNAWEALKVLDRILSDNQDSNV